MNVELRGPSESRHCEARFLRRGNPFVWIPRTSRGTTLDCFVVALLAMTITFLLCSTTFANTQAIYPFTSQTKSQKFQTLIHNIRCVVCQNENIADSSAPIAKDLRLKIYEMVQTNQSKAEIENYLVKRYGEFILLSPRFNKFTAMLWGLPIIILILFSIAFVRKYRLP